MRNYPNLVVRFVIVCCNDYIYASFPSVTFLNFWTSRANYPALFSTLSRSLLQSFIWDSICLFSLDMLSTFVYNLLHTYLILLYYCCICICFLFKMLNYSACFSWRDNVCFCWSKVTDWVCEVWVVIESF